MSGELSNFQDDLIAARQTPEAPLLQVFDGAADFEATPRPWYRHGRKIAALGAVLLAGAGAGLARHFDQSGDFTAFDPPLQTPVLIDNNLKIGTWNVHQEASERAEQIREVFEDNDLDALNLQEVFKDDLPVLRVVLKGLHGRFVMGDARQRPERAGQGNLILTRQLPREVKTQSLAGTSITEATTNGLSNSLAGAWEEDRGVIAVTIKVRSGGKLIDVRNSTTHIGARKNFGSEDPALTSTVHDRQMDQLIRFAEDDLKEGRPSVMGADLNAGDSAVIPRFGDIRMISPESQGATTTSGKTIDHIAYYSAGELGKANIELLERPVTDHKVVIASWRLKDVFGGSKVSRVSHLSAALGKNIPLAAAAHPADIRVVP